MNANQACENVSTSESNLISVLPEGGAGPAAEPPEYGSVRTGKIARLPRDLRQQLNLRMEDGEATESLLAWLNGQPEVQRLLAERFNGQAVNKQNLSAWRRGGFVDWQRRQDALAFLEEQAEFAAEMGTGGLAKALTQLMATELLVRFHEQRLKGDAETRWRHLQQAIRMWAQLQRVTRYEEVKQAEAKRSGTPAAVSVPRKPQVLPALKGLVAPGPQDLASFLEGAGSVPKGKLR